MVSIRNLTNDQQTVQNIQVPNNVCLNVSPIILRDTSHTFLKIQSNNHCLFLICLFDSLSSISNQNSCMNIFDLWTIWRERKKDLLTSIEYRKWYDQSISHIIRTTDINVKWYNLPYFLMYWDIILSKFLCN